MIAHKADTCLLCIDGCCKSTALHYFVVVVITVVFSDRQEKTLVREQKMHRRIV